MTLTFPTLFPNPELKVAPPFNPDVFLIIQLPTIKPPIYSKAHQNTNSYPHITRNQSQWSKQVSSSSEPKPPPPTAGTMGLSKFEQIGAPVAIYHYLSRRCKDLPAPGDTFPSVLCPLHPQHQTFHSPSATSRSSPAPTSDIAFHPLKA